MGETRPLGLIIGLLSCVAVGVAIHFLIQTGSCGGLRPACPSDVVPYTLLLPAGIVGAVLSMFIGGGWAVFSLLFVSVGVGSMSAAFPLGPKGLDDDAWFPLLFGGVFTLSGLSTGLAPLLTKRLRNRKAADAAWLIANGKQGVGRITDVQDTGVTVNDDPRVRVIMQVEPTDGSPSVTLEKALIVSRVAVPRVGESFPVWFDPAKPQRWAFGTDLQPTAAPAIQALFARAARNASPLSAQKKGGIPDNSDSLEDPFDEIARLAALRDTGAITPEEFAATKARLLRRIGAD